MRRILLLAALPLFATPAVPLAARAQETAPDSSLRPVGTPPRPVADSLFRHARRLVAEGSGAAGRALVDSLLRAADPATPAFGDALYWRGALAATAADAERDYRRVIVEYPLAYYADDALLAIAELEQARGDRAAALAHLQRFVKEHPSSAGRGIAALGAARLAFEQRDQALGCSMIAIARSSVPASDVEMRNQVEYHGRSCPAAASTSVAVAPAPAPVSSAPRPDASRPAPATGRPPAAAAPVSTMPEPAAPAPRRAPMYTIQVAAYDTRPPAEQLVRTLAKRGVQARVSGSAKPFRVRLAFYRTRRDAVDAAAALKARGIVGFVTTEVPPVEARSP